MVEKQFVPTDSDYSKSEVEASWQSPSNIALVKYWGKKEVQLPQNPSLSFTLTNCKTITSIKATKNEELDSFNFEVIVDGKVKTDFKPKVQEFFEKSFEYLPFLKQYNFSIETSNTFPHSSGIASSASGMSAIALCLVDIENQLTGKSYSDEYFNRKASFLARLGSGSACRSVEGPVVVWGEHGDIEGSSDLFGVTYPYDIHPNFKNYRDTILLVDKGQKKVSSSVGHNLMHNHPFASERFKQAFRNISTLKEILSSGNIQEFITLVESEALTLHAMMMSSNPYFILMKPNTVEIINRIWDYRNETDSNICFTLDAGANVHCLYSESESEEVEKFISNELSQYCENQMYIIDEIGSGASRL